MPRYVDIVPFHDTDSRHKGYDGSYERHRSLIYAMPLACHPHKEHTYENGYGLVFVNCHLTHCIKLSTEAFHSAFDLRLLFLRFQWEYDFHADEPSQDEKNHGKRESGSEPVGITE